MTRPLAVVVALFALSSPALAQSAGDSLASRLAEGITLRMRTRAPDSWMLGRFVRASGDSIYVRYADSLRVVAVPKVTRIDRVVGVRWRGFRGRN